MLHVSLFRKEGLVMKIYLYALITLLCVSGTDAANNTLTKQEAAKGWKLLFDGKTLDGWMLLSSKKPLTGKIWTIEDEALTLAKPAGGALHCAYTAKAYKNYEFTVEWKTIGNSGILFRVDPTYTGKLWHRALEMQIERDTDKMKSTSAGGIYGLYDFKEKKTVYPDGWNKTRVLCVDGHFTFWLNGQKVHEFTVGSDDWNARVAKSKFKKYEGFSLLENGHIAFQDHKKRVQFRNIKIRELKYRIIF